MVVWDDGSLGQGLWPLGGGLASVYGQLVVVGDPRKPGSLESLQGLEGLNVCVHVCGQGAWPAV